MRWPVTTMRAHPLIDPRIDFVFGSVGPQLKQELRDFWSQHGATYRQQLRSFREQLAAPGGRVVAAKPPASRQPAAISRDQAGMINGIVFVGFRELEGSLGLGSHGYFQRMFILPESRDAKLANQLYRVFLDGFDQASAQRDHRARFLLADNINPGLKKAFMRRYFTRLGFRMLGRGQSEGEVWARPLPIRFEF